MLECSINLAEYTCWVWFVSNNEFWSQVNIQFYYFYVIYMIKWCEVLVMPFEKAGKISYKYPTFILLNPINTLYFSWNFRYLGATKMLSTLYCFWFFILLNTILIKLVLFLLPELYQIVSFSVRIEGFDKHYVVQIKLL